MQLKSVADVPKNEWKGKRVMVRVGLDLPLNEKGEVSDVYRLERSIGTITYLHDCGARVILVSKIGRDPEESNEPVAKALQKYFKVFFVPDLLGAAAHSAVSAMRDGDVVFLENLQRDPREVAGDALFAQALADMCDIYVNDAFTSAHRESATMVDLPTLRPTYAGLLMAEEVEKLSAGLAPEHPSLAILGGAKFETKAPLIDKLLTSYDNLFLVGALANDVFKARGLPVGTSLLSTQSPNDRVLTNPRLIVPSDVTVEGADGQRKVKGIAEVTATDRIMDMGPQSSALIAPYIEAAKTIMWNGPSGVYEKGFLAQTRAVAHLISKSSANKIIGGGDTIAAIEQCGVDKKTMGFLSTGGGAMLEFILKGTLPALTPLIK